MYRLTLNFPKAEIYGITSQIRRSIISVPNNIVEGAGKRTEKDFANFLHTALGSCQESEYLLMLSYELNFVDKKDFDKMNAQLGDVKARLISLIKKLSK